MIKYKRELKRKGEQRGTTQKTKENDNKMFMNLLKVNLTVIGSLRCAFVSYHDTTALTQSSSLACHQYSKTTQNSCDIMWTLLQLTIQLEADSNDMQQAINFQHKQMPKSIGAQIPIKGKFQWVLEIKREYFRKLETQSLKIAIKLQSNRKG